MYSLREPDFSATIRNQRVDIFQSDDNDDEVEDGRQLHNSSAFIFGVPDDDDELQDQRNETTNVWQNDSNTSDDSVSSYSSSSTKTISRKRNLLLDKKLLREQNNILFTKLRNVKTKLVTHHSDALKFKAQRLNKFYIPKHTLEKYRQYIKPPHPRILRKLLRPKIFFDLEVKRMRPLGRVCMQLFTEACPEVVLEFVRMCMDHNARQLEFIRIYPGLCAEAELLFTQKTLSDPLFEYDMRVMDHGFGLGILSFAKCYLGGFKAGVLNFSISFKPLSVLNGERIVFGIVTRGLKVIETLQNFGSSNGKLKQAIKVAKCGVLK